MRPPPFSPFASASLPEQLVTKNALQEATEALKADLLLQMGQIASAKVADLQEDLSATADEAALKVAALESELSATADEAATELRVRTVMYTPGSIPPAFFIVHWSTPHSR